jgi:ABC-type polysaccharide/polyol phosphate export permease
MAPIVEGFRFALLGHGTWEGPMLIFSAGLTALVLLAGMMVFARAERNAADSV